MRVLLARSTAQSVPTNTWTAINWPVADEAMDSGNPGVHQGPNLERITFEFGPNHMVLLNAQVFFASNTTGRRMVRLMKNGTEVLAQAVMEASTLGTGPLNLTRLAGASSGTYFHLEVHQTSGGSLDLDPAGTVFGAFGAHAGW